MPSVSSFQITNDHVKTFQSDATSFKEKFKMEGPASVGTDLDKGEAFSLDSWEENVQGTCSVTTHDTGYL